MGVRSWAIVLFVLLATGLQAQQPTVLFRQSQLAPPPSTDLRVIRQRRLVGDAAVLSTLANSRRPPLLQLDLFPDVSLRIDLQRSEATATGMAWKGTVDGYALSSVVFVVSSTQVLGTLYLPFGIFRIEALPDGSYLVQQLDESSNQRQKDDVVVEPDGPGARRSDNTRPRLAAVDDGTTIDVLVAFTKEAELRIGGEGKARLTVDSLVAQTNDALFNSRVNTRLRLVHTTTVEYEETADSSLDLNRLRAISDSFLDEVSTLRDEHAADLVILIPDAADANLCGRAFISTATATGISAYGIVKRACTGNGRTFAHEIGHLLGANHDWYITTSPGAFPFAHGFVSVQGRFLDLMAYYDLCIDTQTQCAQLLQYSNPRLVRDTMATGVPAGTSTECEVGVRASVDCDADVSDTIAKVAPVVARFRDSRTALSARTIPPGGSIRSANGRYALTYQVDGNLVLVDTASIVLWASNTGGVPGAAILQRDGNFVIYNKAGESIWSTGTSGTGVRIEVGDDGVVSIVAQDGRSIWSTQGK